MCTIGGTQCEGGSSWILLGPGRMADAHNVSAARVEHCSGCRFLKVTCERVGSDNFLESIANFVTAKSSVGEKNRLTIKYKVCIMSCHISYKSFL